MDRNFAELLPIGTLLPSPVPSTDRNRKMQLLHINSNGKIMTAFHLFITSVRLSPWHLDGTTAIV